MQICHHSEHVLVLEKVDGLKRLEGGDTKRGARVKVVPNVLHLLERSLHSRDLWHRTGFDGVHELAEDLSRFELLMHRARAKRLADHRLDP
eukprot:scaffold172695_cov36-Tisochrysis_lutea.AAC.2